MAGTVHMSKLCKTRAETGLLASGLVSGFNRGYMKGLGFEH